MLPEKPLKVYLIRSEDVSQETLEGVLNYLSRFPGLLQFEQCAQVYSLGRFQPFEEGSESPLSEMPVKHSEDAEHVVRSVFFQPYGEEDWRNINPKEQNHDDLFEVCRHCRASNKLEPADHVVLLSGKRNDHNAHTAIDLESGFNYFISTSEWQTISFSESLYPIVYQLVTSILKQYMFADYASALSARHIRPIGCMMDFGSRRKDITIKMRTADVCPDCQQTIYKAAVPHALCLQVFRIMESLRSHLLFRERYFITRTEPHLLVNAAKRMLSIPELGHIPVILNPLEFALYQFFLRHPEGVRLNYLQDYFEEILESYLSMSVSGGRDAAGVRIRDLVSPYSNSASEKISRIKKKLQLAFGNDIAEPLCITGAHAEPKLIQLSRSKVNFI